MLPFLSNFLFHSAGRFDTKKGHVFLSKLSEFGSVFGTNDDYQRDIIIFRKDCPGSIKFNSLFLSGFKFPGICYDDFEFIVN